MEFAFDSKDIREVCQNEDEAIAQYGPELAIIIQDRLADIFASKNIYEIPVGKPTIIDDGTHSKCRINLVDSYTLVFSSNHVKPPIKNGVVNWEKVRNIKILFIENCNE